MVDWYCPVSIQQAILEKRLDPTDGTNLHQAILRGSEEVARLLMLYSPPLDTLYNGQTLYHSAVLAGHREAIRWLYDLGLKNLEVFNKDDETPLMLASKRGSVPMVEVLLDLGADLTARSGEKNVFTLGYTPACYSIFFSKGLKLEDYTPFPVHCLANLAIACEHQVARVKQWFDYQFNRIGTDCLREHDDQWRTPLHRCMDRYENQGIWIYLLEKGADPNLQDPLGETPLQIALRHEQSFWLRPKTHRVRLVEQVVRGVDWSLSNSQGESVFQSFWRNRYTGEIGDKLEAMRPFLKDPGVWDETTLCCVRESNPTLYRKLVRILSDKEKKR